MPTVRLLVWGSKVGGKILRPRYQVQYNLDGIKSSGNKRANWKSWFIQGRSYRDSASRSKWWNAKYERKAVPFAIPSFTEKGVKDRLWTTESCCGGWLMNPAPKADFQKPYVHTDIFKMCAQFRWIRIILAHRSSYRCNIQNGPYRIEPRRRPD